MPKFRTVKNSENSKNYTLQRLYRILFVSFWMPVISGSIPVIEMYISGITCRAIIVTDY